LKRRIAEDSVAAQAMALFYDYNVQVPANLRQVCSVWGELDPVLAVALENREIHFFTDEVSTETIHRLQVLSRI
jgi:hypothetical protein